MNNKSILDLTLRLTQALDQDYDVVNMDAVLSVISALEGTTITKEQLETTRLAKHINQLRHRNKSSFLAIRAKNLLKRWREMVGITSQPQLENAMSVTQQAHPTHQEVSKPPFSSTSQPTSPYATQLLTDNFDNSLSSIGGGVDLSNKTATGGCHFTYNKSTTGGEVDLIACHRQNATIADIETQSIKNTTMNIRDNSKPNHPTSFKNLIKGINASNVSKQFSPMNKVTHPAADVDVQKKEMVKSTPIAYIIGDDNPSSLCPSQTETSLSRCNKLTKRRECDSPVVMAFMEQSNSPVQFEKKKSFEKRQQTSQMNRIQVVTSTIDLNNSNSNSSFANTPSCDIAGVGPRNDVIVSNSSKRTKGDKKLNDRTNLPDSCQFQPTIDESSRIAFPMSRIEEHLSSNSSMSIFPSQQTAATGGEKRIYLNSVESPENDVRKRTVEVPDSDLTFAGKFKQYNNLDEIDIGSGSSYFSNGGKPTSAASSEFQCNSVQGALNTSRDSVIASGTITTSTFLPFSRHSNESTNSRTSQLDTIHVVNQDSQSVITIDDLRQQSSNEKTPKDKDNGQDMLEPKSVKDNNNTLTYNMLKQQYAKEHTKTLLLSNQEKSKISPSTPSILNTMSPLTEQTIPKKRGRKKGSKGVDSLLAQSGGLSTQFLIGPSLGLSKKVKTTIELLADIQNRKLGSATSSPTLMNMNLFGNSRPTSSCSEPSLHSPRTSDACSTNATLSTAARSTPEKNISNNADEPYESDSDSNLSEPSHDSVKDTVADTFDKKAQDKAESNDLTLEARNMYKNSTIEQQIKDLMTLLPPIDLKKIDWEMYDDIPCTCTLREVPAQKESLETELLLSIKDEKVNFNLMDNVQYNQTMTDNSRNELEKPVQMHSQKSPKIESAPWQQNVPHTQSTLVSVINSPVVPSTDQKPVKSIFDLDFDDDSDPLHSFVEAANNTTKTRNSSSTSKLVSKLSNEEKLLSARQTTLQDTGTVNSSPMKEFRKPIINVDTTGSTVQTVQPQEQATNTDLYTIVLSNFPTYEVIEDPNCQAKLRYEIETNKITQFHINALHNCFIANVNGNWDHSVLSRLDDGPFRIEDNSLCANVVPKYGCFAIDRIPKDLSHIQFSRNFKPKVSKKSSKKPPDIFLGVARRRQRNCFHLRQRKYKQNVATKRKKRFNVRTEPPGEMRNNCLDLPNTAVTYEFPEPSTAHKITTIDQPIASASQGEAEHSFDHDNQFPVFDCNDVDHAYDSFNDTKHDSVVLGNCTESYDPEVQFKGDSMAVKNRLLNGNICNLVNNNKVVHCSNEKKADDLMGAVKSNHNSLAGDINTNSELAASRRSSSCSNSSLKQNQNSINMKLRKHRLMEKQKHRHGEKRKYTPSLTNEVPDLHTDEAIGHPFIKRIKIVNGVYKSACQSMNSLTDSSCIDDDGDSDSGQLQSENDMITEEEDCEYPNTNNRDGEDEDEYDEIVDEYDDEDGDDEDEPEEVYGDYHEVITHDITSSTNGNNHIVLTIKKTPSKTNSPSSSSMSPAPVLMISGKQSNSPPRHIALDSHSDLKSENHEIDKNRTIPVDLMKKNNFIAPKSSNILVYRFNTSGNNKNDGGELNKENKDTNDDEESSYNEHAVIESDSEKKNECTTEITYSGIDNDEKDEQKVRQVSKVQLTESIKLAKSRIRRLELEFTLSQSIASAQKVHRKLFFHDELFTSVGSKILELSSCSSRSETGTNDTSSANSDSSNSSSSFDGLKGMKTERILKRGKKRNLPLKKREMIGERNDGGNPPSSSPSSSDSSSSSSFRSFASWSTTNTSLSDEGTKQRQIEPPTTTIVKESESNDQNVWQDNEQLPINNNFLLRSFNHIYVSTEERLRQQQLKQESGGHQSEIVNSGYIIISGNGDVEQSSSLHSLSVPLDRHSNCDAYTNYVKNINNISTLNDTYVTSGNSNVPANSLYADPLPATSLAKPEQQQQQRVTEDSLLRTSLSAGVLNIDQELVLKPSINQKVAIESSKTTIDNIRSTGQNNQLLENEELVALEEYRTGLRKVDEDVDDEEGNNCARTQQFKEWHEVLQLRSYNDELLTVLPYVVIE